MHQTVDLELKTYYTQISRSKLHSRCVKAFAIAEAIVVSLIPRNFFIRDSSSDPIADITSILARLDLLRDELVHVRDSLTSIPRADVVPAEPSPPTRPVSPIHRQRSVSPPPLSYHLAGPFQLGDSVIILNPRPHQESHGIIVGLVPSNFYQIRTPSGVRIQRIARNLRLPHC